jgi:hypothetical protein
MNCLCGEYNYLQYEKINKLSQSDFIIENKMNIKNAEKIDDYDIIDAKDL